MSVTEIQSKTKLSWTTIHKHMKTLLKEGVIIEEEGRYYLDY
jgi:predicted transcriptional regulator